MIRWVLDPAPSSQLHGSIAAATRRHRSIIRPGWAPIDPMLTYRYPADTTRNSTGAPLGREQHRSRGSRPTRESR